MFLWVKQYHPQVQSMHTMFLRLLRFLSTGPETLSRQAGGTFSSGTSTVCFHVDLVLSREGTCRLSSAGGNCTLLQYFPVGSLLEFLFF